MSRGRRHTAHSAARGKSSRLQAQRRVMDERRAERIEAKAREPRDPWACPRPDKRHHGSQERATAHLLSVARVDAVPAHVDVYPCPCGGGWVWGRRSWAETRGEAG